MGKYIISFDQGTTSSRVIVFDERANIIYSKSKEFEQLYPSNGYVEHNPMVIYEDCVDLITHALKGINVDYSEILGLGITNQRETTVLWDKRTGLPIYNAICWQSGQSAAICEDLKNKGLETLIEKKTGLIINPYFSASKIKWILDNVAGVKEIMDSGNLLFGTIDSWLIYKLTGNHYTDITNASRTMLFNIHTLKWDKDLLDIFGINESILPTVLDCDSSYGIIKEERIKNILDLEICGVAGDQEASLIGHTCFSEHELKITYGTGSFMLLNIGDKPKKSQSGLLTTIGYKIGNNLAYALEGSVFIAGAAFKFIRDNLELVKTLSDSEFESCKSNGTIFVPALTGLGAPYWLSEARGAFLGLTRATTKSDLAFATILGVAYLNYDVFNVMERDLGSKIKSVSADGGASLNKILMQTQSDLFGCVINSLSISEATSLGVYYLVGLNKGLFESLDDIKSHYKLKRSYKPLDNKYEIDHDKWHLAIKAVEVFSGEAK